MRTYINLFIFTCLSFIVQGQNYWQQEVNYTISVKLDDIKHELTADESFVYINNSPNTLNEIYIHLWANAYKDEKSALGQQLYEMGNQLLKYGPDSIKGAIYGLDFKIDGIPVSFAAVDGHLDIAKLILPKPLVSGGRITVSTPFQVKIPSGAISRLGHVGQSYQITQWYPKPAVYDKNGWNPIPYLTQGEFYSEYGSFDVSITLPKNYIVGATGDLQTDSEVQFMNSLVDQTAEQRGLKVEGRKSLFPSSSPEYKTIRFTQKNVHDFGWFADKRFLVKKGEVKLPESGRSVTSWALFTPANANVWQKSIEYINDGTYYYSKWNGDYPYNQVTAVDGTISAGGGMEYPNVTVIGNTSSPMDLEIVIVHEVGHNWFYGILGTNERVHGWMDEGMNTLNELRYIYTKYPNNKNLSDLVLGGRFHFNDLSHYDMSDFTYRVVTALGEDQPMETHSAEFTSGNYGAVMYGKTGLVFNYLKDYLGDERFDKAMHAYYEQWKFKHPQPEDMRASLEASTNENLAWLFEQIVPTTRVIDYKLKSVKQSNASTFVTIKNVGQVNGPVGVSAYKTGNLVATKWVKPGDKVVSFEGTEIDEVRINSSGRTPELNYSNNNWHKKGLFGKVERYKFETWIGDNEPTKNNLFWTPMLGGNTNDKFMAGIVLHNFGVPFSKWGFVAAPMYSFGGKRISGLADITYTMHPVSCLKLSRFGVSVRSFKNVDSTKRANDGVFVTVSPFWYAKLGNRKKAKFFDQSILVQSMYRQDVNSGLTQELVGGFIKYDYALNKADQRAALQLRSDFLANVNNNNQLGRFSGELSYSYRYIKNRKSRWAEIRFAGASNYLFNMNQSGNVNNYLLAMNGTNGAQDIFVEDYYFGRNSTAGLWSQQFADNFGGFKNTSFVGTNSQWLAATNVFIQTPIGPSFLGFFGDFGVFPSLLKGDKIQTVYDAGIGVKVAKMIGVYVPLITSQNIKDAQKGLNFAEKIKISLKLNFTNRPVRLRGLI